MMRKLAGAVIAIQGCAAVVAAGLGGAAAMTPSPSGTELFALAEGVWGVAPGHPGAEVAGCDARPVTISIDRAELRYRAEGEDFLQEADILAWGAGWFHVVFDDEARTDSTGETRTWDWRMVDRDTFVWVRGDWLGDGRTTAPRIRCETGALS